MPSFPELHKHGHTHACTCAHTHIWQILVNNPISPKFANPQSNSQPRVSQNCQIQKPTNPSINPFHQNLPYPYTYMAQLHGKVGMVKEAKLKTAKT